MSLPLRVLVIEDSMEDTELLLRELRQGGYEPIFERVDTSEALSTALNRQAWDIVFTDFSMPQFNGRDALNLVRRRGLDVPFIFLSGTIGEDTAVAAMKAGANDYIMKENMKRLLPAVQRELHDAKIRREHQQTEEQLRQSEELFRQLAENIRQVFWMTTVDLQQILYVSPAYEQVWGRNRQNLVTSPLDWVEAIHPEDRKRVLKAAIENGSQGTYSEEYRIIRPDGTIRWIDHRGFPIKNDKEQIYRLAGIAEDITERKKLEQRQNQRLKESEHFNRLSVERELRMVELKRQINELSRQLGKTPPFHLSGFQKDGT